MYTSGCPKNQKICWNRTGSPPPAGTKNAVLNCRSVNNIVIPPARTGSDNTNKNEVIRTDQMNKGMRNKVMPFGLILKIVTIILIEPRIEEAPAKCMLRIAKSTDGPACPFKLLSGGYKVQPVPAPSKKVDANNK